MEWLPGSSIFRDHTPAFWVNVVLGLWLGLVGGRLRSIGTRFEGNRWVLALSATAGLTVGVTIFLIVSMIGLLTNYRSGSTGAVQVLALSSLAQLVIFTLLVLKRRH